MTEARLATFGAGEVVASLGGAFSVDWDIDDTLRAAAQAGWFYPRIRAAVQGYVIHPMHYTAYDSLFTGDPLGYTGTVDWDKVLKIHADGAVLVVMDMQALDPQIEVLAKFVKAQLGREAHCHAYFSNGRYFGFKRHSDRNDIYVLQGLGSKSWTLYPPEGPITRLMSSGELMYVPAYLDHEVRPTAEVASTHLSITIENSP